MPCRRIALSRRACAGMWRVRRLADVAVSRSQLSRSSADVASAFQGELGENVLVARVSGHQAAKPLTWNDGGARSRLIHACKLRHADGQLYDAGMELAGGATKASKKKPATARGGDRGRNGGVVDAPGKKHRKPIPSDPGANIVHSQVEKRGWRRRWRRRTDAVGAASCRARRVYVS